MNLFETLLTAVARVKQLRAAYQSRRAEQARVQKTARRKYRLSRLSRSRWITESQKQGLVVAADRQQARERGDLRSHLVKFYPAHYHGEA